MKTPAGKAKKADEKVVNGWWFVYKKNGSIEAKNSLIEHYLAVVKYTVSRILPGLPPHVHPDDLISAGVTGLIEAIENYDISSNTKFESFANFRIHGSIIDELRAMDWVPRSIRNKARKLQAAYSVLERKLGRPATDTEVSEFLNITNQEFDDLINETRCINIISLNTPIKRGDSTQFSEIIADTKDKLPAYEMQKKDRKRLIIEAINQLPKQERLVLTLYYYEEMTFKEVGEVIGVSESRISQIHTKAIFRLRGKLDISEVVFNASY
ncbi:MAG: FliA/WhiG family RNA polymerase sigma factor [Candidatus Aureabacteria bacterium]|nr:FliA/WhiG family RNA polymerase sigma factor [Candidatus Auribacterota bacterium]